MNRKLRIEKKDEYLALSRYRSEVEEFVYQPLTPAMLYRIEAKLQLFAKSMYQKTRSDIWLFPFLVSANGTVIKIELDPSKIEYEVF